MLRCALEKIRLMCSAAVQCRNRHLEANSAFCDIAKQVSGCLPTSRQ